MTVRWIRFPRLPVLSVNARREKKRMCCQNRKNSQGVASFSWLLALWPLLSLLVIHFHLPLRVGSPGRATRPQEPRQLSAGLHPTTGDRLSPLAPSTISRRSDELLSLREQSGPHTFLATAYCLPGQTASGLPVGPGVIAADPEVLPLGSIVRLVAGRYSGTYRVLDTGAKVRGRMVDIWMPSEEEARRFGVRKVRLHILRHGWRGSLQGKIVSSGAHLPTESLSSDRPKSSR